MIRRWWTRWNNRRKARNLLNDAAELQRQARAMRGTKGEWQGYALAARAHSMEEDAKRLLEVV